MADGALVRIPATSFTMGSDAGRDDEDPAHRVSVSAFDIGKWQVTNGEYDTFLHSSPTALRPPHRDDPGFHHPDQPVVAVSWFDAVRYCQWLGEVTGRPFRLPTEAEWECAARGGVEGALYPWGDDPQSRPDHQARWIGGPEKRATGAPNGFGVYDMCENVHEWCSDWYGAGYYAASPGQNPLGPETGSRRASRGGSWRHQIKVSRCAARSSIPPELRYADYGFRVACG